MVRSQLWLIIGRADSEFLGKEKVVCAHLYRQGEDMHAFPPCNQLEQHHQMPTQALPPAGRVHKHVPPATHKEIGSISNQTTCVRRREGETVTSRYRGHKRFYYGDPCLFFRYPQVRKLSMIKWVEFQNHEASFYTCIKTWSCATYTASMGSPSI